MGQPVIESGKSKCVGDGAKSKQTHVSADGGLKIPRAAHLFCGKVVTRAEDDEGGIEVEKKRRVGLTGAPPPFRSCRKSASSIPTVEGQREGGDPTWKCHGG